jgi:serine/threonine-protein kinase RsbW
MARLDAGLRAAFTGTLNELAHAALLLHLLAQVRLFDGGGPQSDDFATIFAGARIGRMDDFTAELIAERGAISALTERAAVFLAESGVDARAAHHMALVLDELLTNVATHNTIEAPVSVSVTVLPDRVTAEVVDGGAMFDPRVARHPDVSVGVEQRPVGGLGLLLVHRVTEDLAYERAGDRNRTTFSICRTSAERGGRGGKNGID